MNDIVKTEINGTSLAISAPQKEEQKDLVSDDKVVSLYDEILSDLNQSDVNITDAIDYFHNVVVNDGDATSSSKEALVNLLKIKSELADKKSKILDLFVRIKLKDRDTFPRYLVANQKNTIVNNSMDKKKLLEELKNDEANQ